MKATNITNIILVVALVVLGILLYKMKKNSSIEQNDTINTIMTRTSIRRYSDKEVTEQQIEQLLRAGMSAPSACDLRPWEFIVIKDKTIQTNIANNIRPAQPAQQANIVILVCGNMNKLFADGKDYWVEDCSAATENILLAAHAMGLGAVWLGVYPQMGRCELLREMLNIPNNIQPFAMVAIGEPAEQPEPKDKWDVNLVSYNTYGNKSNNNNNTQQQTNVEEAPKTFKEWDITADSHNNPFEFYHRPGGLVLCAGNKNESNAMAIGWGTLGTLWQQPVATVYVAEGRYTYGFMEREAYFTIMGFDDEKILDIMGHKSGRDINKATACNLHLQYTENGTPYYEEATFVIECKTIYKAPFDATQFMDQVPKDFYTKFQAGMHHEYIGKVIKAMKK
ncbi:MAG: nitroreductase family protein [Bacteroidales bacterium]|nr:nitroreductase family protein [Bacteroidales bacterium]